MNNIEDIIRNAPAIEAKLSYTFKDKTILALAFVHRSYVNENKDIEQHNERLEFLGDSVLGMIISEYLYRSLPQNPEGELSYLRSRLVEAGSCIAYINKLGVDSYILLGKGERMNDGRGRDSIHADLFESIIGAIFLDGGLEEAKRFIFKNFSNEIEDILKTPLRNWKAMLQDYCQKKHQRPPVYKVISETGPDHSKHFVIIVAVDEIELGRGEGSSKKTAQQSAAADALSKVTYQADEQ